MWLVYLGWRSCGGGCAVGRGNLLTLLRIRIWDWDNEMCLYMRSVST